ncbi:MAG: hypothetical protein HLUCCA08_14885 [Rhodobacteraceae bacterium HLUCCA08]|nr:MAG: hypothetical protein HLUCCA08_14885 [Rhodobacteraceae bacterium HLUCCA08]
MTLTAEDRATLARLAALMVPGGAGMPSAARISLQGAPLDRVLAHAPQLSGPLGRFCAAARDVADMAGLDAAAQADRDGFEALAVAVGNAYFMAPQVRHAIGYPGQEARDASVGLTAGDQALLTPVWQRGRLWRAP